MTDALKIVLREEIIVKGKDFAGQFRKDRAVATRLVHEAILGNVAAIREVFERIDGKVKQVNVHEGSSDGPPIEGEIRIVMIEPPRRKK